MSKMGQAVYEAQEFATANYNVTRDEFIKLAGNAFAKNPNGFILKKWALEEYDVIQDDMADYDAYVDQE